MHLAYVDESGTPDVPGNTSHYVLAAIAIPIWHWRTCETEITAIKRRYDISTGEIHSGWILRSIQEQTRIQDFDAMSYDRRRDQVEALRKATLLSLGRLQRRERYLQTKKNFEKTAAYVHLTATERRTLMDEIGRTIAGWGFARLFAECIDKVHFSPRRTQKPVDEQAFEQVVSRLEQYLENTRQEPTRPNFGLLIHDNNETVAKRHTELMKTFHHEGTFWTRITNIIETPLFVDSELTSMVQIADVCAYALRRYLENGERQLFDHVFARADRIGNTTVGVRHFTDVACRCAICSTHRPLQAQPAPACLTP